MRGIIAALLALGALAGCGAESPPFRPTAAAGISFGTGGLTTDCAVGTTNGTVSVRVGC